ncbi:hypothetical protein [Oceanibacterium hippocampi]|uniref:Uncharacterized protein n=1 Tax=Oceanibacterium hippocampi TaxID=745714 RepID=A0A1Y5TYY9_9PROT|nr:hypothetical protein [Oceanibacterium hippocampi]SLN77266.1 hypothetical protein OCH7691_04359 [Oceanibacterium hippocampi]
MTTTKTLIPEWLDGLFLIGQERRRQVEGGAVANGTVERHHGVISIALDDSAWEGRSRLRTLQVAAALIAGELDRVIGMARNAGESLPADVLVNPPVKPHRRHRPGDGAEAGQ